MVKGRIQRIEDPVHGLMHFEDMETIIVELLRTREIQRLRRIKQTGLANFVFPGAEHSRFPHSLGAAHLAIRFAEHLAQASRDFLVEDLQPDQFAIRDFAVAALCHDLGHGPLSHAWEREIVGKYDFDKWIDKLGLKDQKDELRGAKWHELVTLGFLAWNHGELHSLLENAQKGFSRRIRAFLRGKYYLRYLPSLLRGDIDVDRADYILRDAQLLGVKCEYDLDWLISTCSVGVTEDGRLVAGFDKRKAVWVVEQFLRARYNLHASAYYHKTVHSIEGMVALFLRRLREAVQSEFRLQVAAFVQPLLDIISGEAVGPSELLALDDFSLWVLMQNAVDQRGMDATVKDLGRRILSRDLFKIVPCDSERINEFFMKHDAHEKLHEAVKPFCPAAPQYYVVKDTVKHTVFSERDVERAYFVDRDNKYIATPVNQHPQLQRLAQIQHTEHRLFTLSEAVETVQRLIG